MLTLKQIKAKITSVQPRAEMNGKNKTKPACTIKIEASRSNLILNEFDPQLRGAFYQSGDEAKGQAELIQNEDLGGLTALRFPWFRQDIKHDKQLTGYTTILHTGINDQSWIELEDCNIKDFVFALKEGGSVNVTFNINCHPTEKEQGRIDHLLMSDIEISILPPQTAETLFDEKKAPARKKAKSDRDAQVEALNAAFPPGGEAA
ncbi:hypothetical protein WM40_22530 [Robbsia andropogonis]|uniref:Uncharacterized protein n=1 Tax=Robbsia andropogonis TaxID=28092 RepID=A0A0F5JUK8_9BURK|nr:hypothetical protein [Robbsia andropogonis]KKB61523.1 hypothetical protein WM40_22530 [Robbsia andropogonis]